jgi:DNA polymerase-3 subunit beta
MKVRVSQEDFAKLLSLVTAVVPTTSSIPVLSNLLLETQGDKIKVSATDLDISVISLLDCNISKEGAITVAAKRFHEIIRELPGEDVDLTVDGNRISITCSRANFKMMGMEKDQFPKIANLEKEERITISADALERMIRRSVYSVAKDDTRPVLSGVLWELSPKERGMVGTDGHRLARMGLTGNFGIKEDMGVIVPPKALHQVLRLIGGAEEVAIAVDKAFVGFFVGDTIVYTRRIEGTFPNYKQVIPKGNENLLVGDRGAFMSAVKRVSLLADSKTTR